MRMAFLSRGFKNLQWYGMTSEHVFRTFLSKHGWFLIRKALRHKAFHFSCICSYISRNTKIAKMFLYASIAV